MMINFGASDDKEISIIKKQNSIVLVSLNPYCNKIAKRKTKSCL